MIYSRTGQSGGLGFAIPVNEAKTLIPDLKRYGRIPRPWLGIVSQRMNPQIAQHYNLGTSKGVLIANLVEDGPALGGGLQQGDIITQVDGIPTIEPFDIEKALAKHKPNESANLKVMRGRKQIDIKIQLEELPKLDKLPPGIM